MRRYDEENEDLTKLSSKFQKTKIREECYNDYSILLPSFENPGTNLRNLTGIPEEKLLKRK